jgi:cysteine-rich repeat protein
MSPRTRLLLLAATIGCASSGCEILAGYDGMRVRPVCGDGVSEAPEECDLGAQNGTGGCGNDCRLVCLSTDPKRDCVTASGDCRVAGTCNDTTHTCEGGKQADDGTPCGTDGKCKGGACIPGTPVGCGNGKLEAGEQCDDGNVKNLDGCDSKCGFEQVHRVNTLLVQYVVDAFCPANAMGTSIVNTLAQVTIQNALTDSITKGVLNSLIVFALADLTGGTAQTISAGSVAGRLVPGPGYDGAYDLDWWYQADPSTIDPGKRTPLDVLTGTVGADKSIAAGPGTWTIPFSLQGPAVMLRVTNTRIKASIGTATMPTTSVGSGPPGHLADEHVDPALTSFTTTSGGVLCANVTAASLGAVTAPSALKCDEGYGPSSSILDAFVGGCHAFSKVFIAPVQPDQVDASVPPVGAGPPYVLTAGPDHKINGCKDKSGAAVDLGKCLAAAAYSSFFRFTTDRVIIRP